MPYVRDLRPEVLRMLVDKMKPPRVLPEADVLAAIIAGIPKLAPVDIVREFAQGRAASEEAVLSVVALAVATEMHARLAAMNDKERTALTNAARRTNAAPPRPFTRGTLKNLYFFTAPPLEDDAELRELAHGIRGCPSALPDFTSPVLPGGVNGAFLPVSSLVAYRHRWACWTQCPLLHPSMGVLEDLSLPPPPEAVVSHLETIIRRQANAKGDPLCALRFDLFERATTAAYKVLADVSGDDLQKIPNIAGRELFWTCDTDTDTSLVRPCASTAVIAVPLAMARHSALLPPFFIPRSHVRVPEGVLLLHRIQRPVVPRPSAVLTGLHDCLAALQQAGTDVDTDGVDASPAAAAGRLRSTYEALLRLLVASCREYGVAMEALPPSCQEPQWVPEGGTIDTFGCVLNTAVIPIPLWRNGSGPGQGQGVCAFQPLADVCQPNQRALLARLDARARIADLPIDLCQQLKMTPMTMRITETPTAFDPFSLDSTDEIEYNSRASSGRGGGNGGLSVLVDQVRVLNSFFRSVVFGQAFARIAAHEASKDTTTTTADNKDQQRNTSSSSKSHTEKRASSPLSSTIPAAAAPTAALRPPQIVLVRRLRTTVTDNRFPGEKIFEGQEEEQDTRDGAAPNVAVCIDLCTSMIFVDPVLLLARRTALCPVIARELNRVLGHGHIGPLPFFLDGLLVSVLHPPTGASPNTLCDRRLPHWDTDAHCQLDMFGCGDDGSDDEYRESRAAGGLNDSTGMNKTTVCQTVSALTSVDFRRASHHPQQEQQQEQQHPSPPPQLPPCASRVIDRFLLMGDDPTAAAQAVSSIRSSSTLRADKAPGPSSTFAAASASAMLRERDLALFATSWDDPFGAVPLPDLVGSTAAPALVACSVSDDMHSAAKKSLLLFRSL